MRPWKASGPDGFHAGFYQENWETVGEVITLVCLYVLNGRTSIQLLNHFRRVKSPQTVTDYRPISLCNVLAKIVAKSMPNRLKSLMPDIISPEQTTFVPGRHIRDKNV